MFEIVEDSGALFADHKKAGSMIDRFFDEYRISKDYTVTVILMNDEDISEYNKSLFKKNTATDVISLLMEETFDQVFLWGEIYVSSETAQRESDERGTEPGDEVLLYIAHGLFHLLGYTDETDDDREHMWKTKIDFLGRCGFNTDSFLKG